MRVLWIATKAPWPPRDGGRLLLAETLAALSSPASLASLAPVAPNTASGIEITLVAPVAAGELAATEAALAPICRPRLVATRPRSRAFAALASTISGRPYSLARHDRPELARQVARELDESRARHGAPYDLVVAEQLQAFAQSAPAGPPGPLHVPRILRAQNVESDLWRQLGKASRGVARTLLLRESARLARRRAQRRSRLRRRRSPCRRRMANGCARWRPSRRASKSCRRPFLAGSTRPSSDSPERRPWCSSAAPAGSRTGGPNSVSSTRSGRGSGRRARPLRCTGSAARGPARPGVFVHRSPTASAEAFSPGAVLVLPLDIASGVRMRVLEAWARGVVIVASPAAASGLTASDGRELLLARDAEEFAVAIERLSTLPGLADRLIAGGRERLAADHAPARFAARFVALAERVIGHFGGARER